MIKSENKIDQSYKDIFIKCQKKRSNSRAIPIIELFNFIIILFIIILFNIFFV